MLFPSFIVSVVSAPHYLAHFLELLIPSMTMFIARDFGMDTDAVIAVGFFLYLLYGVLSLPWGYLADKYSCSLVLGVASAIAWDVGERRNRDCSTNWGSIVLFYRLAIFTVCIWIRISCSELFSVSNCQI